MGEPARDLPRLALKLLLFDGVDEFDGREEPDALAVMLDRLDADGGRQMRLARAGPADQCQSASKNGSDALLMTLVTLRR